MDSNNPWEIKTKTGHHFETKWSVMKSFRWKKWGCNYAGSGISIQPRSSQSFVNRLGLRASFSRWRKFATGNPTCLTIDNASSLSQQNSVLSVKLLKVRIYKAFVNVPGHPKNTYTNVCFWKCILNKGTIDFIFFIIFMTFCFDLGLTHKHSIVCCQSMPHFLASVSVSGVSGRSTDTAHRARQTLSGVMVDAALTAKTKVACGLCHRSVKKLLSFRLD